MGWPVFISYAREDRKTAERFHAALVDAGCSGFLDTKCIPPGKDWPQVIDGAITTALVMVVLLSKASLASRRVGGEWEKAINCGHDVIPWPISSDLLDMSAWPSSLSRHQYLTGDAEEVAQRVAARVAEILKDGRSTFFHQKVLATVEARLDESSSDLCIVGLPGSGISTTLKKMARLRPDVRVVDSRALPSLPSVDLPSVGVIAVLGYPGVAWLAKLQAHVSPKRVRIVAGSAVAPASMEPVLMTPLSDDDIVSMLGERWEKRVRDVARVTGRSPGAVQRLLSIVTGHDDLSLEEIQKRIWGEVEITEAARVLTDLDPRTRAFLATLAIRGSVSPIGKELWVRLLAAASMDKYRDLDALNPLSPFLLSMDGGGVLLRPEIARAIEGTGYEEALPRLGMRVIDDLARAPEMHKLIASAGRVTFRAVLDDARTIALTQVSPHPAGETAANVGPIVLAGSLKPAEEAHVKTTWRVLAHIVQLLPTWREHVGGLRLWNQMLSAIVRSNDIDVRLEGAEVLLRDLLRGVRDELRSFPHWSLTWSREVIPGPLVSEMLHHDPGIIPEVNAVLFGREDDHLWCADSAGFVHKWNWRSGRGSKYGQEKLQQGEVWSIAVVDGGVVLSASDDGSVAVRSGARVHHHQCRYGAMINAVAVADGIVVAGDDDSMLHLWRLIVEDGPRLVNHELIGNAGAGWTLACLIVSRNEVYSSHQKGVICRWLRKGSGSWDPTTIRMNNDDVWIRTLRRDANSGIIFAACSDGKIFRYDPAANSVPKLITEHGASTRGLALVDDDTGIFLATGGDDGVVRLWTAAGEEVSSFGAHRGMIRALDIRGSFLASCGTDGFARVWDIGPSVRPPQLEAMDVDGMAVHLVAADASRAFLASTGSETSLVKKLGTAITLRVSGREISTPRGEIELPTVCLGAMLSSNGDRVLASDIGGRIYFFTWRSG